MSTTPLLTTQTAALWSKSAGLGYSTMKPKLSVVIPETLIDDGRTVRPAKQPEADEYFAVQIDRLGNVPETAATSTATCGHSNYGVGYCLWARCTESEGVSAVLEVMIRLQMRLLVILIPVLLFIIVKVYFFR
ncbi:hypothetical protein F4780DRAFT_781823 [Xylariomycetidae sp. FL0641]|nr:hypothetical protein F4780DRAFT_781823 [Xylariomycetidae sp. FL0641]